MKYLILSDIHFRKKFEKKKMEYLIKLINGFENIIINGDLYEARYIKPKTMIEGPYKPLMEILKNRNTIYIYGNHDPKRKSEELAKYISKNQYDYLKLKIGENCYHIEHGHRLGFGIDNTPDLVFRIIDEVSYQIQKYFDFLTVFLGGKWNKVILKHRRLTNIIKDFETLIVGHTHVKTIDFTNKFVNGGYIKYGRGSYLIITENGNTELLNVKY